MAVYLSYYVEEDEMSKRTALRNASRTFPLVSLGLVMSAWNPASADTPAYRPPSAVNLVPATIPPAPSAGYYMVAPPAYSVPAYFSQGQTRVIVCFNYNAKIYCYDLDTTSGL